MQAGRTINGLGVWPGAEVTDAASSADPTTMSQRLMSVTRAGTPKRTAPPIQYRSGHTESSESGAAVGDRQQPKSPRLLAGRRLCI